MTFHFRRAIENGVTQEELLELITHLAFYAGRPNAISAATRAKELFARNDSTEERVPHVTVKLLPGEPRSRNPGSPDRRDHFPALSKGFVTASGRARGAAPGGAFAATDAAPAPAFSRRCGRLIR